jgi:pimeloyl-ACP methyl ester carboxylesterase
VGDLAVEALSALVPGGANRGELDRGGRTLRWIAAGDGAGPVVVLGTGLGEMSLDWVPVLPALAAAGPVVAYDRAGLGASDPVQPLTLRDEVEDLAAVLAEVGPAVVVGHSWGGLLAQLVAFEHPERVAGLVLVDPSHEEVWASVPWWLRALEKAYAIRSAMTTVLGLSKRSAARNARRLATAPSFVEAYATYYASRRHVRTGQAETRLVRSCPPYVRQIRATAALPDVPVIVLSATTGLPARFRSRFTAIHARLAASAPRGRQIVVADAGHYIHHQQPDVVVQAIADVRAAIEPHA